MMFTVFPAADAVVPRRAYSNLALHQLDCHFTFAFPPPPPPPQQQQQQVENSHRRPTCSSLGATQQFFQPNQQQQQIPSFGGGGFWQPCFFHQQQQFCCCSCCGSPSQTTLLSQQQQQASSSPTSSSPSCCALQQATNRLLKTSTTTQTTQTELGGVCKENSEEDLEDLDVVDRRREVELQAQCERLTMRLLKLADEFQAELDRVKGRRRAYFDYSWSRAALWESVVNFVCAFIPRV